MSLELLAPFRALPCVAAFALAAGAVRAQAPDPFAEHARWVHPASAGSAWLPSSLEFAAGGELLWASAQGTTPHAMLLSTAPVLGLAVQPSTLEAAHPGAWGPIATACGASERELFTAAQYVVGDAFHRRTEVARYDARAPGFAPAWRHSLPLVGNGI